MVQHGLLEGLVSFCANQVEPFDDATNLKAVQCLANIIESSDNTTTSILPSIQSTRNQYVLTISQNQNLLSPLFNFLSKLESINSNDSYLVKSINLLKELFSKRFREFWIDYCLLTNRPYEKNIGVDAFRNGSEVSPLDLALMDLQNLDIRRE